MGHHHDDFEGHEPVPGLPALLPAGERLLWQGKPSGWQMAVHVMHVRKVALWFLLVAAWRWMVVANDGGTVADAVAAAGVAALWGAAACAILALLAWVTARSAIYSITSARVVMRFGIALPVTLNVPLAQIVGADVERLGGAAGSVMLHTSEHARLSWAVLWPHARPWKLSRPQPALRAMADVSEPQAVLGRELARVHGVAARSAAPEAETASGAPTAEPAIA